MYFELQFKHLIEENAFENVVCETVNFVSGSMFNILIHGRQGFMYPPLQCVW